MYNGSLIVNRKWRDMGLMLMLALLSSCFKKDDKIALPPPGPVQITQVALGPKYINQVYFQLGTLDTVGNAFGQWDLAFESSADGYHIWVNGGDFCLAANTGSTDFNSVTNTNGLQWKWDVSSWNADSTAIGQWTNFNPSSSSSTKQSPPTTIATNYRTEGNQATGTNVYVIDRGLYSPNQNNRYWKIIFQTVDENTYTVTYSQLDGSSLKTLTLNKNPAYNYIYFSFDQGVITPEPPKYNWDMLFTRYRHIFTNPTLPYPVEGVLINPYNTSVAVDSLKAFTDIDYVYAKGLNYGDHRRDVIGYDWKTYSFTAMHYTLRPNINYLILDQRGYYWKLHFIDYYDQQNNEGFPKFEFQRL